MLKVVDTLRTQKDKFKYIPFEKKIRTIESKKDYKKYIQDLLMQNKPNFKEINGKSLNVWICLLITFLVKQNDYLEKHKSRVKDFHSIVMAINIGWDLTNQSQYWIDVYRKTDIENKFRINYGNICQFFYKWTYYYAQILHIKSFLIKKFLN